MVSRLQNGDLFPDLDGLPEPIDLELDLTQRMI
jgi:hypothetical protein